LRANGDARPILRTASGNGARRRHCRLRKAGLAGEDDAPPLSARRRFL